MTAVDALGLDKQDRAYLETIIRVFGGGPAGVEAIAHTMNLEPDTQAYQHLQISPPKGGKDTDSNQGKLFP
jgi:Holliday junction resolvasome RuvABC ATP-dependent DNA helicase subunit